MFPTLSASTIEAADLAAAEQQQGLPVEEHMPVLPVDTSPVAMPPTQMPGEAEVEDIGWMSQIPKQLTTTRRYGGQLLVAGEGKIPAEIMFVATALTEEEAKEEVGTNWGRKMAQKARYLKGPSGCILKDTLASLGVDIVEQYYTALIKWLLPRQERSRPKRPLIEAAMHLLEEEIRRVKPKIIVTFGKPAFEAVLKRKIKFDDVRAGWFYSNEYDAKVFVMQDVQLPVFKPELVEKFRIELMEVKRMLETTRGVVITKHPQDYGVIKNAEELDQFMRMLAGEKKHSLSVDCEFGGRNHLDGKLRSLQVCWEPGRARFIRFLNERAEYAFDVPYANAGRIMQPHCNNPETTYLGYHVSTDLPWMHHFLGLDWYEKCSIDLEYAEQVIDENAEAGLERLALRYTDLGRYDIPLVEWKTANPDKLSDDVGYLYVPDEIIIPYGCMDVDAPMRAAPILVRKLMWDKTWDYYRNYRHHLVTDIFTQFALLGLPVIASKLDELRDLYNYSKDLLERKFVRDLHSEARQLLMMEIMRATPDASAGFNVYTEVMALLDEGKRDDALTVFKRHLGATKVAAGLAVFDHFSDSKGFNIRSAPHKTRWLFQVKRHTPVKSTNNKEKGLPSIPWGRVQNLPPEVQRMYSPAADKQTLKIIADDSGDPMVRELLDVLAVGNVCKAFLKEKEVDDEGNLVKENGLHYWVASDKRIHGQHSVTETGRPRSWKPNSLNWPSYVHEGVARGIAEVLDEQKAMGQLPERFEKFLVAKAIPSIRSVVGVEDMPPLPGSVGWCIVESDYVTAEIRGLAFLSGDDALIRLMTEPDDQFGIPINGDAGEDRVRLRYAPDCGIPPQNQRQDFILKQVAQAKLIGEFKLEELRRHPDGSLVHPPHDLHWSLVEWVQTAPRELFSKKVDRVGTGKIGNFSSAYGATANTLERKIKSDTGKTPVPGTGQAILDALGRRQPVATKWLESLATIPETHGFWVAQTGAKRRFIGHSDMVHGLSMRARQNIFATLGREARNFPMQNSVADTAVRAGKWLLDHYLKNRFYARPLAILYDSVLTLCPIEERWQVAELHERFMHTQNRWSNHGRSWAYPIETEFNLAWSSRPSKEIRKQLDDRAWNAHAPWLQ